MELSGPCMEHTGYRDANGYGRTSYLGKGITAHRRAWCIANNVHPDTIKGLVIRHKCDNPPCINEDHLELGSHKDNTQDMVSRGRAKGKVMPGEENQASLLTLAEVREIRASYIPRSRDASGPALARKYRVSLSCIKAVLSGRNWPDA